MGGERDMSAAEMAAYINGMLEGFSLDKSKPETKVLRAVAEAITKLADEVASLAEESERVREYLDELDCDLGELETEYYGCDDDWDDWTKGGEPIILNPLPADGADQTDSAEDKSDGENKDNGIK